MKRFLFLLFFVVACKGAPATKTELNLQLLPYDFAQQTPERISALLKGENDFSESAANARYLATRARLDWFLAAWLNDDAILFDKLAQHLGLVGCSHQEKKDKCLQDIPAKILKDFGEPTAFVPEALQLKSLLSALQLGPRNAAMALGVHSASKKTGEIALRARLAILATTAPVIRGLSTTTRNKALETLAFQSPFICPDSFLALEPKLGNDIDTTAAYCGFACPTHRNGVLSSEDTTPLLIERCTIEYYGFTKGQEHFVTKRNFITFRLLQSLSAHMRAALAAKEDPIFASVERSLGALRPKLEELRFLATLDLKEEKDGLPFSQQSTQHLLDSTPYLVLRGSQLFVALWPTLRASNEKMEITEQQYAHPGKLIGSTQDTSMLAKEISDAASFEFSLGPRLLQEELDGPPPAMSASILGAPEGTKDRGKPIFLLANAESTFQEFFAAGIAATDAGYGRVRILANAYELRRSTSPSAIEVLFARGEDLALLEKSPFGFPGGALVLVLQPGLLRAILPPGLEKNPLDKKLLEGAPFTEGNFEGEATQDFFSYFTAKKIILAVSPELKMTQVTELLDTIKRSNPKAELLLTLAPTATSDWIKAMPKSTGAAFEASNTFSPLEVGP